MTIDRIEQFMSLYYWQASPMFVLIVGAVSLFILNFFLKKDIKIILGWMAVVIFIVSAALSVNFIYLPPTPMIFKKIDHAIFASISFISGAVLLSSLGYIVERSGHILRTAFLMLLIAFGLMISVCSENIVVIFFGLEAALFGLMLSPSGENGAPFCAASKKLYVVFALISAIYLLGAGFIWSGCGQLNLVLIKKTAATGAGLYYWLAAGSAMIFGALLSLASVFGLNIWEKELTGPAGRLPMTAFFNTVFKLGVMVVIVRMAASLGSVNPKITSYIFAVMAILTMLRASIDALRTTDIKALIGDAVSMQLGLALGMCSLIRIDAGEGAMVSYFMIASSLAIAGTYAITLMVCEDVGVDSCDIIGLNALRKNYSYVLVALTIFIASLIGMPPLAGFFARLAMFKLMITKGFVWLLAAMVICMVIFAFAFFKTLYSLWFESSMGSQNYLEDRSIASCVVSLVLALSVIGLGIFPQVLLKAIMP